MQQSISLKEYADIKDSTIYDVVKYASGKGITVPERPDYLLDASLIKQIDPIFFNKIKSGKIQLGVKTICASKESKNSLSTPTIPTKKTQERRGQKVYLGMIKWYDNNKGFGVISTMSPQNVRTAEVFFHSSSWKGHASISTSKPLAFKIRKRQSKGGYETSWCDVFDGSPNQWRMLFDNIEYNLHVNTKFGLKNFISVNP